MAEGSADGASIANGAIGDVAGDTLHGAARDVRNASILDISVGNARTEDEFVVATLDLFELGDTGDVDKGVLIEGGIEVDDFAQG